MPLRRKSAERYPQISKQEFSQAVQLVRADGTIASGARAVFETLGYKKVPFAPVVEWGYRVIASHRDFFYHLTKWTFGTRIEPARFALTQWIFVRLLAVIYAIAFGSLTVQMRGLLGADGILPVGDYLKAVAENAGVARYFFVPTVFWINCSDAALVGVCWAGVADRGAGAGGVVRARGTGDFVCPLFVAELGGAGILVVPMGLAFD